MEPFDLKKFLRSWVLPLVAEVAVLVFIFQFVVNITYVPTGSMIPTIAENSVLLSPRVYNLDKIQRGDILSFESEELGKILIKRLIGMPGDTITIETDGSLYVNGEKLEEPYVVNQEEGYSGTFTVPEDCYFFLGDNRSGSVDARVWENPYISGDKIRSRAMFTIWPLQNFGILS